MVSFKPSDTKTFQLLAPLHADLALSSDIIERWVWEITWDICIVRPVASEPTSPLQCSPALRPYSPQSLKSSSVRSPPPISPSSPVCTASVRLVVQCLWVKEWPVCASRRSFHTRVKPHGPEYHPALLLSSTLFSPTTTIVPGHHGTALFLCTHTPTNVQRGMVRTKSAGCESLFSPLVRLFSRTH